MTGKIHLRTTLLLCFAWQAVQAADYSSEADYYQEFPVVLSASRLSQPLAEAPNAMTVIDRNVQLEWIHLPDNNAELNFRYYHIRQDQHEAFPVYLGGVFFANPVVQSVQTSRDELEVQHTLTLTHANRLVYGAAYQTDRINGQSYMPPLALRLASSARTVARFGGDEFVVMLNELSLDRAESVKQAHKVAEKIQAMLSETYDLTCLQEGYGELKMEHHCSASIGVVVFPGHHTSPENIINCADAAMYQAKNNGRNQIYFNEYSEATDKGSSPCQTNS